MSKLLTEEEWRARDDLRKYWGAFCDAYLIPIDRDDYTDRLENFGLIEWRKVTQRDVDATPFAYELGLEVGGMCWRLTAKGRKVLETETVKWGAPMFTADQLVAHAVGDYIIQSHWMATEKTKQNFAAAVHAVTYTLPFLLISQNPAALSAICGSHFLIDRYRLARFVVWAKNGMRGPVTATGYADDVPAWLSVWLLIAADNILHVICNAVALSVFK